ncbi:MAG: transposase [Nibricoccus sp.]
MPDHLHALISFPPEARMSRVISKWKSYTTRTLGISWQENYFDHRTRNAQGADKTFTYILQKPVVKGLCSGNEQWPWLFRSDEMSR